MFSRQIPKGLSHIGNAVWTKTGSLTRSSHQFKKLSAVDSEKIRDRIATIVGDSNVSVANIVRSQHGQDEGPDQGMIPDVVAFPGETAEVSEVNMLIVLF